MSCICLFNVLYLYQQLILTTKNVNEINETKMETIKYHITQSMVRYVANASADRYGQLKTMDVYAVFGDRTKEVLEYLKQDPIIKVNTYGWTYGTYAGIGSIHDIQEESLRTMCLDAWDKNENRIRNLNQW